MIARAARSYVVFLSILALLLVGASLWMNVSVWLGRLGFARDYGPLLFIGSFLTGFPASFLAKDRRILKNEARSCPIWLRWASFVMAVYGVGVFCLTAIFPPGVEAYEARNAAALPLVFDAVLLLVMYAVVRNDWQRPEIVKRSGLSFVVAVVCAVVFFVNRAAYMAKLF